MDIKVLPRPTLARTSQTTRTGTDAAETSREAERSLPTERDTFERRAPISRAEINPDPFGAAPTPEQLEKLQQQQHVHGARYTGEPTPDTDKLQALDKQIRDGISRASQNTSSRGEHDLGARPANDAVEPKNRKVSSSSTTTSSPTPRTARAGANQNVVAQLQAKLDKKLANPAGPRVEARTSDGGAPPKTRSGVNVDHLVNYDGQPLEPATRHGVDGHVYVDRSGNQHFVSTRTVDGRPTQTEVDYEGDKIVAKRTIADTREASPTVLEEEGSFDSQGRLQKGRKTLVTDGAAPRVTSGEFDEAGRLVNGQIRSADGSYNARVRTRVGKNGAKVRVSNATDTKRGRRVRATEAYDAQGRPVAARTQVVDTKTRKLVGYTRVDYKDGEQVRSITRAPDAQGRQVTTRVQTQKKADGSKLRTTTVADAKGKVTQRARELYDDAGKIDATRVDNIDPRSGKTTSSRYTEYEDGRRVSTTATRYDAAGRKASEVRGRYDDQGGLERVEDVTFGPKGEADAVKIYDKGEAGWTMQVERGGRRFNLAAGEVKLQDGVPVGVAGPSASAQYDGDKLVGFHIDIPSAPLSTDPSARDAQLDAFSDEMTEFAGTLANGLREYQSDTFGLGFQGGDRIGNRKKAFAGLMRTVRDLADARNARPVVTMSRDDERISIELRSKTDNQVIQGGRFMADLDPKALPGVEGAGIGVYPVSGDGQVGGLRMMIYGPKERWLPVSTTKEINGVTGTDAGDLLNTLGGIRTVESTQFTQQRYGGHEEGWQKGRTVDAGSVVTSESSGALGTAWRSLLEAGESVVAVGGSVASGVIAGAMSAGEAITRGAEELAMGALGAYGAVTGDRAKADALRASVDARRYVAERQIADMGGRAWENLTLNPLVGGLAYGPSEAARRRDASRGYLFNAPRELIKAADGAEGAERKALLGTALVAQGSLDFLQGVAAFGPVAGAVSGGGIGAKAFHGSMLGLAGYGAYEGALGDRGVLKSLEAYKNDPNKDTELALVQSLSHLSNAAVPFVAGALPGAGRSGAGAKGSARPGAGTKAKGPTLRGASDSAPGPRPAVTPKGTGAKPRGPGLTAEPPVLRAKPKPIDANLRNFLVEQLRIRAAEGTPHTGNVVAGGRASVAPPASTGRTFRTEVGTKVLRYDNPAAAARATKAFRDAGLDVVALEPQAGAGDNAIAVFTRPDPSVPANASPTRFTRERYRVDPEQGARLDATWKDLNRSGVEGQLVVDAHIHPPSGPRGTPSRFPTEADFSPGDGAYYRSLVNQGMPIAPDAKVLVVQARPFYGTDGFRLQTNEFPFLRNHQVRSDVMWQTDGGPSFSHDSSVLPARRAPNATTTPIRVVNPRTPNAAAPRPTPPPPTQRGDVPTLRGNVTGQPQARTTVRPQPTHLASTREAFAGKRPLYRMESFDDRARALARLREAETGGISTYGSQQARQNGQPYNALNQKGDTGIGGRPIPGGIKGRWAEFTAHQPGTPGFENIRSLMHGGRYRLMFTTRRQGRLMETRDPVRSGVNGESFGHDYEAGIMFYGQHKPSSGVLVDSRTGQVIRSFGTPPRQVQALIAQGHSTGQ